MSRVKEMLLRIGLITFLSCLLLFLNPLTISFRGGYELSMIPKSTFIKIIIFDTVFFVLLLITLFFWQRFIFLLRKFTVKIVFLYDSKKLKKIIFAILPLFTLYLFFYLSLIFSNKIEIDLISIGSLLSSSLSSSLAFALILILARSLFKNFYIILILRV